MLLQGTKADTEGLRDSKDWAVWLKFPKNQKKLGNNKQKETLLLLHCVVISEKVSNIKSSWLLY